MREIVLGNDNAAVELKITIAAYLRSLGVRVEDLVLVTEDGCEVLNHYSKEFEIIGSSVTG